MSNVLYMKDHIKPFKCKWLFIIPPVLGFLTMYIYDLLNPMVNYIFEPVVSEEELRQFYMAYYFTDFSLMFPWLLATGLIGIIIMYRYKYQQKYRLTIYLLIWDILLCLMMYFILPNYVGYHSFLNWLFDAVLLTTVTFETYYYYHLIQRKLEKDWYEEYVFSKKHLADF